MVLPVCFRRRIQLETKSLPAKPAFSYHNSPVTVAVNKRMSLFFYFISSALPCPACQSWDGVLTPSSRPPPPPVSLSSQVKVDSGTRAPLTGTGSVPSAKSTEIIYCDCHQSNFPKMATALFPVFIFPCAFTPPQHLDTPYEEGGSVPSPLEPGWDFAQP